MKEIHTQTNNYRALRKTGKKIYKSPWEPVRKTYSITFASCSWQSDIFPIYLFIVYLPPLKNVTFKRFAVWLTTVSPLPRILPATSEVLSEEVNE